MFSPETSTCFNQARGGNMSRSQSPSSPTPGSLHGRRQQNSTGSIDRQVISGASSPDPGYHGLVEEQFGADAKKKTRPQSAKKDRKPTPTEIVNAALSSNKSRTPRRVLEEANLMKLEARGEIEPRQEVSFHRDSDFRPRIAVESPVNTGPAVPAPLTLNLSSLDVHGHNPLSRSPSAPASFPWDNAAGTSSFSPIVSMPPEEGITRTRTRALTAPIGQEGGTLKEIDDMIRMQLPNRNETPTRSVQFMEDAHPKPDVELDTAADGEINEIAARNGTESQRSSVRTSNGAPSPDPNIETKTQGLVGGIEGAGDSADEAEGEEDMDKMNISLSQLTYDESEPDEDYALDLTAIPRPGEIQFAAAIPIGGADDEVLAQNTALDLADVIRPMAGEESTHQDEPVKDSGIQPNDSGNIEHSPAQDGKPDDSDNVGVTESDLGPSPDEADVAEKPAEEDEDDSNVLGFNFVRGKVGKVEVDIPYAGVNKEVLDGAATAVQSSYRRHLAKREARSRRDEILQREEERRREKERLAQENVELSEQLRLMEEHKARLDVEERKRYEEKYGPLPPESRPKSSASNRSTSPRTPRSSRSSPRPGSRQSRSGTSPRASSRMSGDSPSRPGSRISRSGSRPDSRLDDGEGGFVSYEERFKSTGSKPRGAEAVVTPTEEAEGHPVNAQAWHWPFPGVDKSTVRDLMKADKERPIFSKEKKKAVSDADRLDQLLRRSLELQEESKMELQSLRDEYSQLVALSPVKIIPGGPSKAQIAYKNQERRRQLQMPVWTGTRRMEKRQVFVPTATSTIQDIDSFINLPSSGRVNHNTRNLSSRPTTSLGGRNEDMLNLGPSQSQEASRPATTQENYNQRPQTAAARSSRPAASPRNNTGSVTPRGSDTPASRKSQGREWSSGTYEKTFYQVKKPGANSASRSSSRATTSTGPPSAGQSVKVATVGPSSYAEKALQDTLGQLNQLKLNGVSELKHIYIGRSEAENRPISGRRRPSSAGRTKRPLSPNVLTAKEKAGLLTERHIFTEKPAMNIKSNSIGGIRSATYGGALRVGGFQFATRKK